MHKIHYEIELNDEGRPCIGLSDEYEQKPEDKFFAVEITRYILQELFARRKDDLDETTREKLEESIMFLGQIGDEMAGIQYDSMRIMGETEMLYMKPYHVMVQSMEERDDLPEKNIIYNNKIFDRQEGLRVAVQSPKDGGGWHFDYYELQNGVTNENWVKL
jgi:hypothetical protein